MKNSYGIANSHNHLDQIPNNLNHNIYKLNLRGDMVNN
jgi:hypothetical protein